MTVQMQHNHTTVRTIVSKDDGRQFLARTARSHPTDQARVIVHLTVVVVVRSRGSSGSPIASTLPQPPRGRLLVHAQVDHVRVIKGPLVAVGRGGVAGH